MFDKWEKEMQMSKLRCDKQKLECDIEKIRKEKEIFEAAYKEALQHNSVDTVFFSKEQAETINNLLKNFYNQQAILHGNEMRTPPIPVYTKQENNVIKLTIYYVRSKWDSLCHCKLWESVRECYLVSKDGFIKPYKEGDMI